MRKRRGGENFELVKKMARPYMIGTDRYQNNYLLFKGAPERIFVNRSYKEGSDISELWDSTKVKRH